MIHYDPDKSVIQNAIDNGVSVPTVRKYIKEHKIDRMNDERARVHAPIHKMQMEHPDWSARRIARELGISQTTASKYMKIDSIVPVEGKWSARRERESITFNAETPIDFMRMEEYDTSKLRVVAFSNGLYQFNGHSIGFSNMKEYPIDFMGYRFNCPETAYIACCYSLNNDDCIRIQKEIHASTNGLKCKRQYRYNKVDRTYGRKDFHQSVWHFNLMLYLVWLKCQTYPKFSEMLLAIPDDTVIIENQNGFKKVKVGDWGCKNRDSKLEYDKRVKELKNGGRATTKIKEKATIETWGVGVWKGMNHCGKILMACRAALRRGSTPNINFQALNDAEIYLFGKRLTFNNLNRSKEAIDNQSIIRCTTEELLKVCTYPKKDVITPFRNDSILSNFYPFTFTVDGVTFHSAEQYYHWRRLEGFPEYQADILSFDGKRNAWDCYEYVRGKKKPSVRLEKKVRAAIEMDYEKRFQYMREALQYKLQFCEGFKEALLETGGKIIAERDQTRGKQDIWAVKPSRTECIGANILGKLLMEVREFCNNKGSYASNTESVSNCQK